MDFKLENIRGIIAIQNHGGSGSLFFQSLLDNHPEIMSLPALYGRELIRFWLETQTRDIEEFAKKFVESPYHAYWFNPDPVRYKVMSLHGLHTLGDNKNETIPINKEIFTANLILFLSKDEFNLKNFIYSTYLAYAKTRGSNLAERYWLLFPFHNNPLDYAKLLVDGVPIVKFIHVVREPIQCLASGIRYESKQEHSRRNLGWALWLLNPDKGASPLIEGENISTRAIRLEDLHTKPEKTMRAVSASLDIQWNEVLLQSTFNGKKWWNRSDSVSINGSNPSFVKFNGRDIIPFFDRFRMEFLFSPWKKAWNYHVPFYVNNVIFEKLVRILLYLPFKIDFLPEKIPSTMKKISYFKLLFAEPVQEKKSVVATMKVNMPVLDPATNTIKIVEVAVEDKNDKITFSLQRIKLLRPIINFSQSIKNVLATRSIQFGYFKEAWKLRKMNNNFVKLLPLDD